MSVRWLLLVGVRPFIDEVELLYEFMSVTGEATVMIMVCLNYFKSIPIPPTALLIASLLIVGGNLGAQVGRLVSDSWITDRLDCIHHWVHRCKRSSWAAFSSSDSLCTTSSWSGPTCTATASRRLCSDGSGPITALIPPLHCRLRGADASPAGFSSRGFPSASTCRAARFGYSSGAITATLLGPCCNPSLA